MLALWAMFCLWQFFLFEINLRIYRFSRFFFHQIVGITLNIMNLALFSQQLKGRCHGNQF